MWTHWLGVIPLVTTFMKRQFDKTIGISAVVCTSINHWRKPEVGVRQKIDIITVFTVGVYNSYMYPRTWIPVNTVCLGIWYTSRKLKKRWIHSFLHILPVCIYLYER